MSQAVGQPFRLEMGQAMGHAMGPRWAKNRGNHRILSQLQEIGPQAWPTKLYRGPRSVCGRAWPHWGACSAPMGQPSQRPAPEPLSSSFCKLPCRGRHDRGGWPERAVEGSEGRRKPMFRTPANSDDGACFRSSDERVQSTRRREAGTWPIFSLTARRVRR